MEKKHHFGDFLLGVNYFPRHRGVKMWQDWRPKEIDAEFAQIAELGIKAVRIFLIWDDFQPVREIRGYLSQGEPHTVCFRHDESRTIEQYPEMIDEDMVAKFDELLALARKHGLKLMPVLLVGWMGETVFEVGFRNDRNIFTDPTLLKYQTLYARYFARRYKDEDTIIAWDIANEQNCFSHCPSQDAAWHWTNTLAATLRLYDPNHPITSGMHGLGMSRGSRESFLIRDVAEHVDFTTVHPYPLFFPDCVLDRPNSLRATYLPSWQSNLYQGIGRKPVLCQELGTLGDSQISRKSAADYLKTVLYSLFCNGDMGAFWWNFTDYTCPHIVPYDSCIVECDGFGLFDADGNPKATAGEYARFAEFLRRVEGKGLRRKCSDRAAIVVPWMTENHSINFNSFILAKQAGLDVDIIRPEDSFIEYKLIVIPSAQGISLFRMRQWDKIIDFVRTGGTLYLSYEDAVLPRFGELFGFKLTSKRKPVDKNRMLRVVADGCGPLGTEMIGYEGLPNWTPEVEVTTGRLLAIGKEGLPLMIENDFGLGKAIVCLEPIEKYLSCIPDVFENDNSYRIYAYAKWAAGCKAEIEIDHPFLERATFGFGDDKLLIVINHSGVDVEAQAETVSPICEVIDLMSGAVVPVTTRGETAGFNVCLKGNNAVAYRIGISKQPPAADDLSRHLQTSRAK